MNILGSGRVPGHILPILIRLATGLPVPHPHRCKHTWHLHSRVPSTDSAGNSTIAVRTVVVVEDASLPFISLNEGIEITHEAGTEFIDPGAVVKDADGAVIKDDLINSGDVDAGTPGEYTLSYSYTGEDGKEVDPATLKIVVVDTTAPEVELKPDLDGGSDIVKVTAGDVFEDPGLTFTDEWTRRPLSWTSLTDTY